MKKLNKIITLIVVIVVGLVALKSLMIDGEFSEGNHINIYNWGEYIDPVLIEKFEEETGISVVYEVYDSNESMYTKVKTNSSQYDIIVPSEYMLERMGEEDLLIPLDYSKIKNFSNIDEDLVFDELKGYGIPYFWGTFGIVYNKELTDLKFESWDDLWDESLTKDLILVDSAREILGLSLNSLGYSLNSTDLLELRLAQEKLLAIQGNVDAIISDEMLQLMPQGEASVAVTWSGAAMAMISENEDLEYSIPKEGSNIWFDFMSIPITSQNPEGAYAFINFMLEAENAAVNAEYVQYSTANKKAREFLDQDLVNDQRFYPTGDTLNRLEYYHNLGKSELQIYNDLFLEFKMF